MFVKKILFFETSEDVPSPKQVVYFLRNYGVQGIYDKVSGLVFGRARGYSEEMNKELFEGIVSVVNKEFGSSIPILANFDFGHTDPQYIMPLGINAEINPMKKTFRLTENILD